MQDTYTIKYQFGFEHKPGVFVNLVNAKDGMNINTEVIEEIEVIEYLPHGN